jgi:multidrug efflux pump
MAHFFIERPILAWVIAIIIMLAGVLSITRLPISRYPSIAPPSVQISASYPGASARTVENSVTQIIEQNMTGLDGLLYFASTSDQHGQASITLTFASGTSPDIAQILVQNKLQQVTPLLPQIVQQQGIIVAKASGEELMDIGFVSDDDSMSANDIDDYVASHIVSLLSRVAGVLSVQIYGSKYAMRIWLDANKLNAYALTPGDVTAAVQAQNTEVSIGQLGDVPAVPGQQLNATVTALGRLESPQQFRDIILRSDNGGGAALRLSDVARVELGQSDYGALVRYNGKPASGMSITLASGANALSTARRVETLIGKLKPRLPAGLRPVIPYDTTPYARQSIEEVLKTLGEAILLVFLVLLLFLQNLRATLIPTIAVPVVLLGTFAVLWVAGYSINMLTLFAVVLGIGLVVDDAIVVVENVERLMSEEGLSPVAATHRSMEEITGALVGIASVLSAVFIPMAFLRGSIGVIYRQFSITIVSAMVLSVIVAIVLTPALCATLLQPVGQAGHRSDRAFFRWFTRAFESTNKHYQRLVMHILGRPVRFLVLYVVLVSFMGVQFIRLPAAFLPDEDQSVLLMSIQAPTGATQERTLKAMAQAREYLLEHEKGAVASLMDVVGFSLSGGGQNSGFGFVQLRDWSERRSERLEIAAVQSRLEQAFSQIKDALVFAFAPPPILELGYSSGFDFYLMDNLGQGHTALTAARDEFLALAAKDKLLANVRAAGQDDAPQFHLDIDAQKASSFGLSMSDINDTLAIAWGGRYIGDFIDRGQVKRVIMQADAPFRMVPEDFGRWFVRNDHGNMVAVVSFSNSHWEYGSPRLERYNGFSAMEILGEAAPGVSSGAALKEVEKLVAQVSPGFSAEFTGQSYEERAAAGQTPLLYSLSLIVVFLWLAALYESWSIPAAILLTVPLGIMGAVMATALRGLESNIYFQVAMLTTMGLTSKNAILIVEFAKEYVEKGMPLIDATLHAARDRLRPILMTSLAFGFGVLPLAVATGAGAGAQRAIGTGVFGGMVAGTLLGVFFTPLFFVVVQRLFRSLPQSPAAAATEPPLTARAQLPPQGA